jgi:hypothetical protein
MRSFAARVRDLVLKGSNETSSLAASLSLTEDLIEGHVDFVAANGVHWGARLALITTLSHCPELSLSWSYLGLGAMQT